MRYLVGYTADARGAEAIALASALGGAKTHLDIAIALPEETPFSAVYPGSDHGYSSIIANKVDEWAKEALTLVPAGISARVIARAVPSPAAGLISVAKETGAQVIVLGGRKRHMAGIFAPGSVASALLHSSPLPVALGTPGSVATLQKCAGKISRVTAFVGTGAGLKSVVQAAAASALTQGLPLRVVSLVALEQNADDPEMLASWIDFTRTRVSEAVAELEVDAEVLVASGSNIDAAIAELSWKDGEVAVVGSSRLARKKRLFMGSTAQRMLRTLPVPLIVVPRNYKHYSVAAKH